MKLTIVLESEKWNSIISLLNELPFRITDQVAPIMREIIAQGMEQMKPENINAEKIPAEEKSV